MGLWCDMMIRCVVFCRVWDLVWLWGLFLSNAECYTRLKQIPKMGMWSVSAVWVCWAEVVWVRLIDYVGLWDLYCDPLWHDNVIWFCLLWDVWLSGLWWSGLILYSLGYIWVGCWNVFFYVCQSWSHAEHFFLIYVVGRVWSFGRVVYWACVCCCWYILVF